MNIRKRNICNWVSRRNGNSFKTQVRKGTISLKPGSQSRRRLVRPINSLKAMAKNFREGTYLGLLIPFRVNLELPSEILEITDSLMNRSKVNQ